MKIIDLHSDIFTDVALRRAMGEQYVIERIHLPNLQKGSVAGIIDVSHLDEPSSWDVIETSNQPLLASHCNAKELSNHKRNLTDE